MEDEDKVGVLIELGLEAPKTAKKVNFLLLISNSDLFNKNHFHFAVKIRLFC